MWCGPGRFPSHPWTHLRVFLNGLALSYCILPHTGCSGAHWNVVSDPYTEGLDLAPDQAAQLLLHTSIPSTAPGYLELYVRVRLVDELSPFPDSAEELDTASHPTCRKVALIPDEFRLVEHRQPVLAGPECALHTESEEAAWLYRTLDCPAASVDGRCLEDIAVHACSLSGSRG